MCVFVCRGGGSAGGEEGGELAGPHVQPESEKGKGCTNLDLNLTKTTRVSPNRLVEDKRYPAIRDPCLPTWSVYTRISRASASMSEGGVRAQLERGHSVACIVSYCAITE